MLAISKVCGAIVLIIPRISWRIKEWAYAGFAFNFIAAIISDWAVDGFGTGTLLPVIFLIILSISYTCYHKLGYARLIQPVSP